MHEEAGQVERRVAARGEVEVEQARREPGGQQQLLVVQVAVQQDRPATRGAATSELRRMWPRPCVSWE